MKILAMSAKKSVFVFLLMRVLLLANNSVFAIDLPVQKARQITIADALTFTATVEAVKTGTVSAQTNGRVIATLFDVGDLVQKNDVILKLRDTRQKAEYESAGANVKASKAQYNSAEKEFVRISDIYKKRLVSRADLDKVLAQRDASKAALEAAIARLSVAKAQLDYTRVRAPYNGIVLKRHVEIGETVNPGTPLYTGMSLEFMRVLVDVPQKDIDAIRRYKQATIELPQGKKMAVAAEALTFFGYADPINSTFKVRVNLPKGIQGLYPGMYLKSSFKIGERVTLVIPSKSIIHRGEVTAVYVKNNDKLSFRQIIIGSKINKLQTEVLSGLTDGEAVVTNAALAIEYIQNQHSAVSGVNHE